MSKEIIRKIAVALAAGQDRIVRPKEASAITGRSLSSIWRDSQAGRFVPKYKTGANSTGYLLSDISSWINSLQEVTSENVQPVAVPALGKQRGRRCNSDNNVKIRKTVLFEEVNYELL